MIYRIIRSIFTLLGLVLGYEIAVMVVRINDLLRLFVLSETSILTGKIVSSLIFAMILYLLSPKLILWGTKTKEWMENRLQKTPMRDILYGFLGLFMGLLIANLFSRALLSIPWVGPYLLIAANLVLGYIGASVAIKKREELSALIPIPVGHKKQFIASGRLKPKILDTSVIIDGRIADICQTGFLEGPIIVPRFVLEELRHIADSSDVLKRNRGRRGLDILNRMQKEMNIEVQIYEGDFDDISEVDSKLVKLAQMLDGKIITNDFNLNKVAELHKVPVLNINELANAVKPIVLPGEEMVVQVVKDGKEAGQGVAYLDDGTMIVVDGGKKHIGETIDVLVTSVLQTAAGRMIFAKPKSM
ncbi:MAG: PIN/TRAM domain-containing protein [Thermosediminibacteraceae bacterium]|nr:PIN/TRAM domain-containing protein [Thermosediminibacteraceae bacterium]